MATKCPQCQAENPDQSKFCADCGSRLFPPGEVLFAKTMTLETGYKVLSKGKIFADKYAISGEIGRGGMGVVYKAEDIKLKRTVALKFLPPELSVYPEAKERFIREAQSAAALSHPNICTIHEVEEVDGQPYIAMEFVSGESLRQRVAKVPMDSETAVDIAVQVASGLEAAHQRGIIHRDIKSANIMVTDKGQAKIMDFGLAKVAGESQLTKEARTIGTIAYMSPEQAQGEDLDKRTDLWSFGVVLYELLTGQLPFRGDRESIILHSIVKAEPKSLRQIKADIPIELEKIIDRALKKKREDRYASAEEMASDLRKYLETRRAEAAGFFNLKSLARRMRRPAYYIPAAALLLAFAGLAFWGIDRNSHIRWARRVAMPEIQRLYQDSKFAEALKIAVRAEKFIAKDPEFKELLLQFDGQLAMESDPPGASVYIKEYSAKEAPWQFVGKTPLSPVRMARGDWRIKMEKSGCEPKETWYYISGRALDHTVMGDNEPFKMNLDPQGSAPPGMVRVQGTSERLYSPLIGGLRGAAAPVALPDYFLDRFEVSNRQYKAFVDGGGYRQQKFWKHPFVRDGGTISWDEAMKLLVDKTGVPAPSGWELGDYPPGKDDYPVSGVSWYEAAAYAEFAGKVPPTVFHWAWSMEPIPQPPEFLVPLSNFDGKGPAPVGISQAMGPAGTFDQCGNVKEWCWNAMGDKRLILGGAWNEPDYMGFTADASDPIRREGNFGFRCLKYAGEPEPTNKALDPIAEPVETDYAKFAPCSDEVFEVVKGIYAYEKIELEPKIEFRREHSEYAILEKVSFWDAFRKYRVLAYIFLPRKSRPPFQAVFYLPGSTAQNLDSIDQYPLVEAELYFKNGRAVIVPVIPGFFDRKNEPPPWKDRTPSINRELAIRGTQDFRRCVDYLETRPADFLTDQIACHGLSIGATLVPFYAALETRIRAAVAIGGGIVTGRTMPVPYRVEQDMINFLPRVKIPFLAVNGKYDIIYPPESNLKIFMRLLGTPEKDKYLKLYDSGHVVFSPKAFKDILDFLDKYLGPVI